LYKKWGKSDGFFKNAQFFARLSGNSDLKGQIESGMSAQDIEKTWQPELDAYKQIREKYLLYSEDVSN
jgi:uncharacterized protein YbbC (DUF1343 family)